MRRIKVDSNVASSQVRVAVAACLHTTVVRRGRCVALLVPGDIFYSTGTTQVYFPVVSMLVFSLLANVFMKAWHTLRAGR